MMTSNLGRFKHSSLVLALCLLTACSSGTKPVVHKPSKLPELPSQMAQLQPLWKQRIGGAIKADPLRLQVAMVDGLTVAASRQGSVEAWQLSDGKNKESQSKALWSRDFKKTEITSGVVLQDGVVIVGTAQGVLMALDAKTGATRWTRQLSAALLAPALVFEDRVVVMANDGSVTGTALSTGQPVWNFDVSVPPVSVRGLAAPVLFDRNVIVSSAGGRIYSLNVADGVPQWERRVAVNAGRSEVQRLIDIDGDPLLSGRSLYVASYQGQLVSVDLDNQRVRWSADSSSLRSLASGLGNVYVASVNGALSAYDETSGKLLWTQNDLAYRDLSNPVVLGRYLVVGDAQGYLHLIEQTEGKIIGRVRTSGAVRFLRVVDDRLLVQSASGALSIWQNPK